MERKREGNPPEPLCFLSKKRKGGGDIFSSTTGRVETSAIFYTKCTGGWGGEESCPALNPLQCFRAAIIYCSLLCAAEGRRKKKRREHWRERKPASLCRKRERELVFICAGQKKQDIFPLHQLQGASSLLLRGRGCICVSFSGRQTATPRLLLMMRADVRLVSMNIDVEDSLFHRRTERGKMAAL